MRKMLFVIAALVSACGGDATGTFNSLTGVYNAVRLPTDPAWVLSWPSSSTQTGCAQIESSKLTFTSSTAVSEDRGYKPLQTPFVVTLASYTGTYAVVPGANEIVLRIDGGIDTATIGTYLGQDAFIAHRRFPDYTSCGSVGPYTIVYSK